MFQEQSILQTSIEGTIQDSVSLPYGGWAQYEDGHLTVYISSALANVWVNGFALVTLLCSTIQILAYAAPPASVSAAITGVVCSFIATLSSTRVNSLNVEGGPGFYIHATTKPTRVWVQP